MARNRKPHEKNYWATDAFIGLNVVVFAALLAASIASEATGIALTAEALGPYLSSYENIVTQGRWYAVFTSGFLHLDIRHLFWNMSFLYLLGRLCESAFGTITTAAIYLLSMIGGDLAFIMLFPGETAIGASGAVFGLAGAAMLGAPEKSLLEELPVAHYAALPVVRNFFSAGLIAVIFAVPNVVNVFSLTGGVAYIAHVGGMAVGAALAAVLRPAAAKNGFWLAAVYVAFLAGLWYAPSTELQAAIAVAMLGFIAISRLLLRLG